MKKIEPAPLSLIRIRNYAPMMMLYTATTSPEFTEPLPSTSAAASLIPDSSPIRMKL